MKCNFALNQHIFFKIVAGHQLNLPQDYAILLEFSLLIIGESKKKQDKPHLPKIAYVPITCIV